MSHPVHLDFRLENVPGRSKVDVSQVVHKSDKKYKIAYSHMRQVNTSCFPGTALGDIIIQ